MNKKHFILFCFFGLVLATAVIVVKTNSHQPQTLRSAENTEVRYRDRE